MLPCSLTCQHPADEVLELFGWLSALEVLTPTLIHLHITRMILVSDDNPGQSASIRPLVTLLLLAFRHRVLLIVPAVLRIDLFLPAAYYFTRHLVLALAVTRIPAEAAILVVDGEQQSVIIIPQVIPHTVRRDAG